MLQGDYWMNIKHGLLHQRFSISEIARIYGIDRKTVRRYLKATDKPKYTYKKPRHKVIEDYADFINEKLKEHLIQQ